MEEIVPGTLLIMVPLDQRESQIDTDGDTSGRPYLAGLYEQRLGINANFGELLGQLLAPAPMGDNAALVK